MKVSGRKKQEFEILYVSLISSKICVLEASNVNLVGISGELVFESANLFYISTENGLKKVLKRGCVVEVLLDEVKYRVVGDALLGTLVSRIKKIK